MVRWAVFTILTLALTGIAVQRAAAVTVGAGPSIGSAGGVEYFEEYQDWSYDDCRAVDSHGDSTIPGGGENARDLVAFYAHDNDADGGIYFRADFLDLFVAAEDSELDLYVLIDFDSADTGAQVWPDGLPGVPAIRWDLAVALYSGQFWNVYDASLASLSSNNTNQSAFRGAYFRSDLDAVEFGIDRSLLTEQGWNGTSTLRFQVASAKDFEASLADVIPDSGSVDMDANCPTAKYAFVLHGNQAISPATTIQGLVRNEAIRTPNDRPTGYYRALESARVFGVPANIHVSATLLASSLWAANPGNGNDGVAFVEEIAAFFNDDPNGGEGALIWGVYSEHIMPFFEGSVNRDSISLNENYLQQVLRSDPPNANSVFWIPERVARGSTFEDLKATGYGWTILDQINHLREWFGNDAADGFKIHRINDVNCFMINDEPDRFKFANTDGGLWIDTRRLLVEKAIDVDQEQLVLVFDDWEAYAGRSFLSFNTGSDNPDNFNTNLRWLANRPWIQIVSLEEVASWAWTPIDHGTDISLPFETYDFLDHATENSYENWYQGSGLEEDFDGFQPFIRRDSNIRTQKMFGALSTYVPTNGAGIPNGPGTIAQDVFSQTFTGDKDLFSLARLSYSTAIFETAWHDEDNGERCPDGTYCNPDTTFDNVADFAAKLQFLNLRRGAIYAEAAEWAATKGSGTTAELRDIDHDGENEGVLFNSRVFLVFENDGGRLITALARRPDGSPVAMMGNLLGFPDSDDEEEASSNGGFRVSGLSDWWAMGPDTSQYVNEVYAIVPATDGFVMTSPDGNVSKTVTLDPGSNLLEVDYSVSAAVTELYVRCGLSPDLENLLVTGQSALQPEDDGERFVLENTQADVSVEVVYAAGDFNASYNAAASDGTDNSPRNMAQTHMIEISGSGTFSFGLRFNTGSPQPVSPGDLWTLSGN